MNIIRDEILNVLIAGRDAVRLRDPSTPDYTTKPHPQIASTLTFVVFLLSLHPEVFQRLRDEVLEMVGPTEQPTYEKIRDMKYLRAVLNGWSKLCDRELILTRTEQRPFVSIRLCTPSLPS